MNKYVKLTGDMLQVDTDDELIAKNGFEHFVNDNEKCVLIMGLNPAGDEKDVDFETSENYFHLRYIPDEDKIKQLKKHTIKQDGEKNKESSIKRFHYPTYFKPIYEMVRSVFKDKVKWDYMNNAQTCYRGNVTFKSCLEERIEGDDCIANFIEYCEQESKKEISICIGEMFYYHKTSSTELEKMYNNKTHKISNEDIKEMLDLHITDLSNAKLQFIYVNNGKASKLIYEALENKSDYSKSYSVYKGIPIFYGGMLSNGVIDTFSKNRLVNEIRVVLNIED